MSNAQKISKKAMLEWKELNEQIEQRYIQELFSEATEIAKEALKVAVHIFDPDHPHVVTCLNNLGLLYFRQGDSSAILHYKRALAIEERSLGKNHRNVKKYLDKLKKLERDQNGFTEACFFYERAKTIAEKSLSPHDPIKAFSRDKSEPVNLHKIDFLFRPRMLEELSAKERQKFKKAMSLVRKHLPELRKLGYNRLPSYSPIFSFPVLFKDNTIASAKKGSGTIWLMTLLWDKWSVNKIAAVIAHELLHLSLDSWHKDTAIDRLIHPIEKKLQKIFNVKEEIPKEYTYMIFEKFYRDLKQGKFDLENEGVRKKLRELRNILNTTLNGDAKKK